MEKCEKLRDYDLWAVSRALCADLPIVSINKWVKAHQDESTPLEDLSQAALINISIDKLAGDRQHAIQGSNAQPVPHYGPEDISLFICGSKITNDIRQTIENHHNGRHMRNYIINKFNWTGEIFNLVDWDAMEGAMSAHKSTQLTNITKYASTDGKTARPKLSNSTRRENYPHSTTKSTCVQYAARSSKLQTIFFNATIREL